jgi:hypothetical protein
VPAEVARTMVRLHAPEVLLAGDAPRDRSSQETDRSSRSAAPPGDGIGPMDAAPAR